MGEVWDYRTVDLTMGFNKIGGSSFKLVTKGVTMALVQKNISNVAYYTDGVNYYTFHLVNKNDALWTYACSDLGITKRSGFTAEETAQINELAGTGIYQKSKYRLLKNGQAIPMPYKLSIPDIKAGDVVLRQVPAPSTGLVKCPHCASSVLPGPTCSACGKSLKP